MKLQRRSRTPQRGVPASFSNTPTSESLAKSIYIPPNKLVFLTDRCLPSTPLSTTFQSLKIFLAICTVCLAGVSGLQGQTPTDPVGYTTSSCLSNSDTFVSMPFTLPPEFTGTIQSVTANTITVSTFPWTVNQFVYFAGVQRKHYYALLGPAATSNPEEGRTYLVTGNSANSLTLDVGTDSLVGVPSGTALLVIPYWTLDTVFPASSAGSAFTATTSTRSFKTEILVPINYATGVNLAYSKIYFFSSNVNGSTGNVGWRTLGDNTTDHGDDTLAPESYFLIRNLNSAATLSFYPAGAVLTKKFAVPLFAPVTGSPGQDRAVCLIRPVDVTLANTGLSPADGSFVATTDSSDYKDRILVYDNSQMALNKSPSATYFYSNNVDSTTNNVGWRLVGDDLTAHDDDMLIAGSGFIIRKAPNGAGQTVIWTNVPTY